jgi:glycosyltransferase involved in cell wall biosynthesis
VGHLWGANVDAAREVEKLAAKVQGSDILFLIVGRVGERFKSRGNVIYTGFVEDIRPYFAAADVAINPMVSGTGMNLKLLEYLAAGLPTVTTPVGARGVARNDGEGFLMIDLQDFADTIEALLQNEQVRVSLSRKARRLAESEYTWEAIAKQRADLYSTLLAGQNSRIP